MRGVVWKRAPRASPRGRATSVAACETAGMNSLIRALVVALSALLPYSLTAFCASQSVLTGRVVKVIDGDTIDIRLQSGPIRIRFYGVDAPEKSQAHGRKLRLHFHL